MVYIANFEADPSVILKPKREQGFTSCAGGRNYATKSDVQMAATKIRWGIIGVGDVTEVKSGPALQKIADSSIVAVMRRHGDKARDYARRHGVPRWYDDADRLINDPEVNAVYIATPPHVHADYTRRAAAAGKAVYVEKPMARTFAECQQMISACRQAGVPLFVAYYRRALPSFLKVKEIVDSGRIGQIRAIDIRLIKTPDPDILQGIVQPDNWRVQPEISGGGYFHDLAAHQLDILDFICGPIGRASGFARNQAGRYAADDIVSGTFLFENGIPGLGLWCFTASAASSRDTMKIIGSEGEIDFACFDHFDVTLRLAGQKAEVFTFERPQHIQQPLLQTVVDDLLGRATCPSKGETAARTSWVMDQLTAESS